MKEAAARINIKRLLEAVSWRYFADRNDPASIQLELSVTLQFRHLEALGGEKKG